MIASEDSKSLLLARIAQEMEDILMPLTQDSRRRTEARNTYYDGYCAGIEHSLRTLRKAIETQIPDWHERLAKIPNDTSYGRPR